MDSKMPGNIMNNMSDPEMMQQAQHIWSMLDDMAANNPESYRKFIDKQMKDGKEFMKPPQPHMCVQTNACDPKGSKHSLFMNIFEWQRIPAPKDDQAPISILGGPIYGGKDDRGPYKCLSLGFNPEVLKEFGLNSKLVEERKMLINLAIDYIQDQHKYKISRNYTLLNKDNTCKGSEEVARRSLVGKYEKHDKEYDEKLKAMVNIDKNITTDSPMIDQLSNIVVSEKPKGQSGSRNLGQVNGDGQSELKIPGNVGQVQPKPGLVQEISPAGNSSLPEPQYEMTTIESDTSSDTVEAFVIKIHLEGVTSVAECELDISEEEVNLFVPERYELEISLPRKVLDSESSAKFHKKSCTLTVTLPIMADR